MLLFGFSDEYPWEPTAHSRASVIAASRRAMLKYNQRPRFSQLRHLVQPLDRIQ